VRFQLKGPGEGEGIKRGGHSLQSKGKIRNPGHQRGTDVPFLRQKISQKRQNYGGSTEKMAGGGKKKYK